MMSVCVECLEKSPEVKSYLLDGLEEMRYCFTEWTKAKEVGKGSPI